MCKCGGQERLSNLARAGFDATLLVRSAAAVGSLPDDHPAAALWWASSTSYRKRQTKSPPPQNIPTDRTHGHNAT